MTNNRTPSPQTQSPAKTPLDEIALIAKAANPGPHHIYIHSRDDNNWKANAAFHEAITPQLVISLIEAIQAKPEPVAQLPQPHTCQPHQHRVVHEKAKLDEMHDKLRDFIGRADFTTVVADERERERLYRQSSAMAEYSKVLGERIDAF